MTPPRMTPLPPELNQTMRGPYEHGEPRPPLAARKMRAPWTAMEAAVFNAITQHWDRQGKPLFSERLRVADAMLAAFDRKAGS